MLFIYITSQKDLKVIAAYVVTYFRSIAIKEKEVNYIEQKLRDIIHTNEKYQKVQRYISDMMTRLALSILKFAKAISCRNVIYKTTGLIRTVSVFVPP